MLVSFRAECRWFGKLRDQNCCRGSEPAQQTTTLRSRTSLHVELCDEIDDRTPENDLEIVQYHVGLQTGPFRKLFGMLGQELITDKYKGLGSLDDMLVGLEMGSTGMTYHA